MIDDSDADLFSDAYDRWAAGRCPCCGGPLEGTLEHECVAIGEGVTICGWCVGREHQADDDGAVTFMLRAIAAGAQRHRAARRASTRSRPV